MRMTRLTPVAACAAWALSLPEGPAAAQGADALDRRSPTSVVFGAESVRLPNDERMGLVGGTLLFEADGWWFGPGLYGAASGERGGLFVGGVEVQRRWRLGPGTLVAGLFAGGGGGAAAPVGGGLMLRPALSWLADLGPLQAGLSYSAVRFPSGDISSSQFGLVVSWDGEFHHGALDQVGSAGASGSRSGLGADTLAGTLTTYDLRGTGGADRRIGLGGIRLDRLVEGAPLGGRWHWGVEAAAAASGDAAGYMEVLGHGGWDLPLTPGGALRAGVRGALGLGGGGAVPTGGGAIAKVALNASLAITPSVRTGLEFGRLVALDTPMYAPTAQWWLSVDLQPTPDTTGLRRGTLARTEWTAAIQHYANAARRDGSEQALQTFGIKFARYASEHLYATGQGYLAFAGDAGAYGTGLVGLGLATRPGPWRAGAELMVGAAGGGGVATQGGAIVQALAWGAWSWRPELELRVGVGGVRARDPGLSTPIFEVSITRAFAELAP
jgi:hypothetical protein